MGAALQCCVKLFGVKRGPRKFHFVGCRPRVLTLMAAAYVMILLWRGRPSFFLSSYASYCNIDGRDPPYVLVLFSRSITVLVSRFSLCSNIRWEQLILRFLSRFANPE